ncbi:MAG: bifunctional diaminohydroxyphosphoribosylaminopyrimidine deaminase/5-amino-6-(5-phosphoribosylamino)uracil reductase RibD [Desulfatiglans sp.]|nr:bifunctional diaminohydroxyphosphoribosylaminopyrimidine deaminase/5-amino-6-(5-phosphoribosylamino)uracil reductase RibD [Desulfatiglans sp.]
MKVALHLARKGLGRTSPNPAVGAVIVKEGRILSKGYHKGAGLPHAEVDALNRLGSKAPDATLYVNLEPCNHYGKTPPCTEAILNSGIRRVVVGMEDPNPKVRGGGCLFLRENGISITSGVLEEDCRRLNEAFIKYIVTGRPFAILKSALTLDGWMGTKTGDSKWISNEKSRQFVHRLRDRTDALLVGVGTVLADNPSLTTRLSRGRGKDPIRVIVDTHLRTPLEAKVLNHDSPEKTLLAVGADVDPFKLESVLKKGVSIVVCPVKSNRIDLNALMEKLGAMSITSLLVEAGGSINGSMLREKLIDKLYLFKAPKVLGGDDGMPMAGGPGPANMDECLTLKNIRTRRFMDDILIEGYPDY